MVAFHHSVAAGIAAALLCGVALLPAEAAAQGGDVLVRSRAPYWQVGHLSSELSQECRRNRFGERQAMRYRAVFDGPDGAGILGIAKGTGLNLYDPKGLARPDEDYFFADAGTSACTVYVARHPPAPR